MTKLSFITLALLTGVGCAVVACSSDGDDTTAAGGTGGTGASTGGKGGGTTTGGKGTVAEGGASGAAGEAGTLFDRLGGTEGITAAVSAIVDAEVQDADIASYFSQSSNPAYTPTVADIEGCLVVQLSSTAVSGGPTTYPAKLPNGYQCRNMAATHADLGINSGTFDQFVMIAAGVLAAPPFSVSEADLGAIGGVLVSTKTAIVTDKTTTAEKPCTAPAACALGSAGAGGAG